MGRVRILEDHLVNQIAAGEVVERPASVVKELVENALDAGATRISVRLREGGRALVEIEDNGQGMDPDDVLMCLERHGTSKIRTDADLVGVSTLGFRGEALPSIASVSRFHLVSRPREREEGLQVRVDGGRVRAPSPVGCPPGTRVVVRDLFFNVPARRKFLRRPQTEQGHAVEAVRRQALIRPQIAFSVAADGRQLLRAPVVAEWATRVADLLKIKGSLIPVGFESGALRVQALLGTPDQAKAGSAGVYLYVNGRFVRDALLRRALHAAYAELLPKGRGPTAVLQVFLPPEDVDVNVHPAKVEVRFRLARDLHDVLVQQLREALLAGGVEPLPGPFVRTAPRTHQAPLPLPTPGPLWSPPPPPPDAPDHTPGVQDSPTPSPEPLPPQVHVVPVDSAPMVAAEPEPTSLRPLGPVGDYWLFTRDGALVVLDARAALTQAQRVHLEQGGDPSRLLLPPIVSLDPARAAALGPALPVLAAAGLEVVDYGGGDFAVTQVPAGLAADQAASALTTLAGAADPLAVLAALSAPPIPDEPERALALALDNAPWLRVLPLSCLGDLWR